MSRLQAEKMVEKEDLGLSLSLSFPEDRNISRVQMNLIPSLASSPSASHFNHLHNKKYSWNETFSIADRNQEACGVYPKPFLKGIDVNRSPTTADVEEGGGMSSPNSTISSISGKRSERELGNGDEHDAERACSRGISDEEDGETSRKKLRLSKDQSAVLEESFKEHHTLNPKQKLALAKRLGLTPRQVEVWFQNRRARTKLKQTEVDCEFLKRCCENLTEENRRLQKELQELRALKLSPHLYMQMTPATTLTMCRSCERVATGQPTTSTTAQSAPSVDLRPLKLGPAHQRTVPFNLWATSAVPHSMDALQSRS